MNNENTEEKDVSWDVDTWIGDVTGQSLPQNAEDVSFETIPDYTIEAITKQIQDNNAEAEKQNKGKKPKFSFSRFVGKKIISSALSFLMLLPTIGYGIDTLEEALDNHTQAVNEKLQAVETFMKTYMGVQQEATDIQFANIDPNINPGEDVYEIIKLYTGNQDLSIEQMNTILVLNGVDKSILTRDGQPVDLRETFKNAIDDYQMDISAWDANLSQQERTDGLGEIARSQGTISDISSQVAAGIETIYTKTSGEALSSIQTHVNNITNFKDLVNQNGVNLKRLQVNEVLDFSIAMTEVDETAKGRDLSAIESFAKSTGSEVHEIAQGVYGVLEEPYNLVRKVTGPVMEQFISGVFDFDGQMDKIFDVCLESENLQGMLREAILSGASIDVEEILKGVTNTVVESDEFKAISGGNSDRVADIVLNTINNYIEENDLSGVLGNIASNIDISSKSNPSNEIDS